MDPKPSTKRQQVEVVFIKTFSTLFSLYLFVPLSYLAHTISSCFRVTLKQEETVQDKVMVQKGRVQNTKKVQRWWNELLTKKFVTLLAGFKKMLVTCLANDVQGRNRTHLWRVRNWHWAQNFWQNCWNYRKTPLISTYVFSGLATEQALIFGAVLTFGGMIRRSEKSCKKGVCSIQYFPHTTRCCACFSDYAPTSRIPGYLNSEGMYFRGIATDSKFQ